MAEGLAEPGSEGGPLCAGHAWAGRGCWPAGDHGGGWAHIAEGTGCTHPAGGGASGCRARGGWWLVSGARPLSPCPCPLAGQLAAGTCEIVTLDRDSSQPRRTIARQTARCACRKGQIAGTTRARPACVDGKRPRRLHGGCPPAQPPPAPSLMLSGSGLRLTVSLRAALACAYGCVQRRGRARSAAGSPALTGLQAAVPRWCCCEQGERRSCPSALHT